MRRNLSSFGRWPSLGLTLFVGQNMDFSVLNKIVTIGNCVAAVFKTCQFECILFIYHSTFTLLKHFVYAASTLDCCTYVYWKFCNQHLLRAYARVHKGGTSTFTLRLRFREKNHRASQHMVSVSTDLVFILACLLSNSL